MSGVMRAFATRLLDGRELPLTASSLRVGASLASPARTMAGVFPVAQPPGRLGAVRVELDGEALFLGRVDRQSVTLSAEGLLLRLECRDKGRLLLDNEARPCVLAGVNLAAVFALYAAPYGFLCYSPNPAHTLASYTVRKDLSAWEALCGFTRRCWGIAPYVDGDTVVVDRPRSHTPLVLSNAGGGHRYSSLEACYLPYHMVSRVVMRDAQGVYGAGAANPAAAFHGVERVRYAIPSNEFVDAPALDANARIRRSMLDSEYVEAVLPELLPARLGQEVRVLDSVFRLDNLLVSELRWQQGAGGATTTLWLQSSLYR